MSEQTKESRGENSQVYRKIKSELFHIWKKARLMYDMVKEGDEIESYIKNNIRSAYEAIDESIRYLEFEEVFPNKKDTQDEQKENNFLTNEDKRYPVPVSSEGGDQFITRCILDANMKKRYPVQSDRFQACMTIFNEKPEDQEVGLIGNPGEKFKDPMQPIESEIDPPQKPILP